MKKLLLMMLGMIFMFPAFAHDFTYTYEGQSLTYTVTNEIDKYCMTKAGYTENGRTTPGNNISGKLVIPSVVKDGDVEYSVTSIGPDSFYGCTGLTSVEIPNSVTFILEKAFYKCSGLTSVEISDAVLYICEKAFYNCSKLTSVKIPNSVVSIEKHAFYGCSGLTSVEIPQSVFSIDDYAFSNCSGLTSIKIPDSGISLGRWTFRNCSNLTSVEIPKSVDVSTGLFKGCSNLASVKVHYDDPSDPSRSTLSSDAFDEAIYSNAILLVPEGTLFAYIKTGWNYFKNIRAGDQSTTTLSDGALFYRILENTESREATLVLGDYSSLTEVTIPDRITDNRDEANPVTYYVTKVGPNAFKHGYLKTVRFNPNSCISAICEGAFLNCSSLTSIEIPNSVKSIGDHAFEYCYDMVSVIIGNSVTSIGRGAFDNCSNLTSVEIPNSVTSIGRNAFLGCIGLTSVGISNSITSIEDGVFSACIGLTSVEIPNSVTSIGLGAFSGCINLISIEIPNSVTSMGSGAFANCRSLTSVEIPKFLTSIGEEAFYGCNGLTSVYYDADEPINGDANIFPEGTYEKATLYMTKKGILASGSIDPWKNFKKIVEHESSSEIDEITTDFEVDAPYEVYNLNGTMISDTLDSLSPGIYIFRQGRAVKKIIVK